MTAVFLARSYSAYEAEHGGPDAFSGVVKRRVGDSDVPQYARVTLLRTVDKAVVRRTWSDPASGGFSFVGIDASRHRYIALAEYPTNPDDPTSEDYMRPVAGVTLKRGES